MVEPTDQYTFVFTKAAVIRSIRRLEACRIHEHFAGYLAILRATKNNNGLPIRLGDIAEFHDRYLRVVGAPERSPYVRPFKSRGQGFEMFNSNVAGSYAPSSLRSRGKLIDVIEVAGERRNATYRLRDDHAALAFARLLTSKVPVGALTAFLYRDYGFRLAATDVGRVVRLFRDEFWLSADEPVGKDAFAILFEDDWKEFSHADFEAVSGGNV